MGGGDTSKTTTSPPQVPGWMQSWLQGAIPGLLGAQGNLPNLTQLYGQIPRLGINPLTGEEAGSIAGLTGLAGIAAGGGPLNPTQGAGVTGLENFIGSPGTPSPATLSAINQFGSLVAPSIMQNLALSGQATGGAVPQSLISGASQFLTPVLLAGEQNQLQAAGALQQGGLQQQQQAVSTISQALQAQGIPRDIADRQAQAQYDQQLAQQRFATELQLLPTQLFGNVIGGGTNVTTSTPAKF